jgi:sugar phosphate isomerase/epimerase
MNNNTTSRNWELSYYIAPIGWNGSAITFDADAAEQEFINLHNAGINWAGFNGINLLEPAECELETAVTQVREMMGKYNIRISSFHFAGPTMGPINESQELIRDKMLEAVQLFSQWHPRSFVIHAGWMLGNNTTDSTIDAYQKQVKIHGFDKVLETVAENLKIMAKAAAGYDINLALENMGKFLPLGQINNLPELVGLINENNVGYCLDSGHAHAVGESVIDWVKICDNRLFETHFHDNRALGAGLDGEFIPAHDIDEHLSPGFGTISWIDVIKELESINFPGPITFETGGWPNFDIVSGYQYAITWWRTCEKLASLK